MNTIYSFFIRKMENKCILIQSHIRGYLSRKNTRQLICKNILYLLERCDKNVLQECYFQILQVLKQFPPAKNEYKFIYGKLIEHILIETFNIIKTCKSLDNNHTSGSEYKYDCIFNNIPLSIKASKNVSNITIINKNSKSRHYIGNMNFIICYINEKKLCIFPSSIINKEDICYHDSKIDFKARIYKYLSDWSFTFPELSEIQIKYIENLKEINTYDHLYNTYICKNM